MSEAERTDQGKPGSGERPAGDSCPPGIEPDFDVLLIDGRSGSGKTALADRVAGVLRREGRDPVLLRVEDLYPGWDGLAEGSRAVADVLRRREYRPYDWIAARFGEPRELSARLPLIVEGCGAVTPANLAAAEVLAREAGNPTPRIASVWLTCATALRRTRALDRDGDDYEPHWGRWAEQETALFDAVRPWEIAQRTLRTDGSSAH